MLNSNPLVSVIIPAYNIADYLPRCLDSVLGQTYKNLEVIVVSDGSTDGTNEIIKRYAGQDNRIVPVFKENSGVSDTRNKGIEMAKGDYIGFIDGDDYIEANMYETLLDNALKYDADISHCGYQMVFPSRVDYYFNTQELRIQDNKRGIFDFVTADKIEPGLVNKLFKKEIIKDIRLEKDIKFNEDTLFNLLAFKKSKKSVFYDVPLYHYILRKDSATGKANIALDSKRLEDVLRVAQLIIREAGEEFRVQTVNRYLCCLAGNFRTVILADKTIKNRFYTYIRNEIKKYYKYKVNLPKTKKLEVALICRCPLLYKLLIRCYYMIPGNKTNKYEVK
ncbi:MAG: glycosyltransferase family 2 protein [Ruminococcus sp.]